MNHVIDFHPAPLPARRPPADRFQGRLVALVPLDPSAHADSLYEGSHGAGEDDLWRYMGDGPFAGRAQFAAALERKAASQDPLFFAITRRDGGHALGYAAYLRMAPEHRVIEVGSILYTRHLQRTTAATEAMYLMARYIFEDLGYRRYEWKCDARNEPSRRAALRLGFRFEGIFRQHMIVKGRNRDTAWFSMLDSEWPARKAEFERWLAPANFDPTGRQRSPLRQQ